MLLVLIELARPNEICALHGQVTGAHAGAHHVRLLLLLRVLMRVLML